MATKAEITCWLIEPMQKHLKGEMDQATIAEWLKHFTRYTEEELRGGWSIYFNSAKYRSIPMPSEVHAAIREYRAQNPGHVKLVEDIPGENPRQRHERKSPWKEYNPWDDEEYWTNIAKRSPLYPDAVEEGFPLSFINWTINKGTPPTKADFPQLHERFDWLVNDVEKARAEGREVPDIGQAMIDKNTKLIEAYQAYLSRVLKPSKFPEQERKSA